MTNQTDATMNEVNISDCFHWSENTLMIFVVLTAHFICCHCNFSRQPTVLFLTIFWRDDVEQGIIL